MEDIVAIAQVILRRPEVMATTAALGGGLALVAWFITRGRCWRPWRRIVLGAAGFAFAALPSTTLARPYHSVDWRVPQLSGSVQDLLHTGILTPSPENLLNLVMLAPFGFLAALATRRCVWIATVALLAAAVVELAQGATGIGVVEAADVVQNVAGAAMGAVAGWVIARAPVGRFAGSVSSS